MDTSSQLVEKAAPTGESDSAEVRASESSNALVTQEVIEEKAPAATSAPVKVKWSQKHARAIWWFKFTLPWIVFVLFAIPIIELETDNPKLDSVQISRGAGIALLIALLWVLEPIPLAVTAFVPAFAVPLLGIAKADKIASAYFNHIQFLFLGGFVIGEAMERWALQKRVSLKVMCVTGMSPRLNLAGCMVVSFVLSMFMSNTAACLAIMPNALSILRKIEEEVGASKQTMNVGKALIFGVALMASVGGTATIIGTPPNAILILKTQFPDIPDLSFVDWIKVSLPVAILIGLIIYAYLSLALCPKKFDEQKKDIEMAPICPSPSPSTALTSPSPAPLGISAPAESPFKAEYKKLGPMNSGEMTSALLFLLAVVLWLFRTKMDMGFVVIPGWDELFPENTFIADGVVGAFIAFVIFCVYVTDSKTGKKVKLLDWKQTCPKLPWDIVMLMGAGFALSNCMQASGLSEYIGGKMEAYSDMNLFMFIFICCLVSSTLSNVASHTAMANVLLPIIATICRTLYDRSGIHPWTVLIPVTLSNSASYCLPIGTPPNTIAYSTGKFGVSDFLRHGTALNVVSVLIYAFLMPLLIPVFLGYEAKY